MRTTYFIAPLAILAFATAQNPIIEIPQGFLRGSRDTARNGREFYQFTNIPFAKPPVGNLRFKAPAADEGWEGVRDNNYTKSTCFQYTSDGVTGSEDCLYLSVYTPELPRENYVSKPVMVFIHGGKFTESYPKQGPKYLLSEDVVYVSIGYRVGIFGFFNIDSPTLGAPGNAGMKDQVLALQWVQDNIAYFGGDPNNVLLFGESAGAASVHLQILSPMAAGLFHKAISESGVALLDIVGGMKNNGILLAEELGIQTENLSDMLETFQEISARDIIVAAKDLSQIYDRFNVPTVETESNEPSFLTNEPINLIRSGTYNHVPYIIGYNDAEGLMFQLDIKQATGNDMVITDFTRFIPPDLQIEKDSIEEAELAERIRNYYYGDTEPSSEDITQAVRLYTDCVFGFPSYRSAVEHLRTANSALYFYFFSADTELNLYKRQDDTAASIPGASHGDEMHYLFDMYGYDIPEIIEGSVEDLAIKRMVRLWTNFAKYDSPTTSDDELNWEPLTEDFFNYLHIDSNVSSMQTDLSPAIIQFWEQIYADYYPGSK